MDMRERLAQAGFTQEQLDQATEFAAKWVDNDSLVSLAPGVALGSCLRCGAAIMFREDEFGQPDTPFARHVRQHGLSWFGGF